MKTLLFPLSVASLFMGAMAGSGQDDDAPPPPIQGVEIQTRGPIHESFAQPNEAKPEAGELIPRQPPEPVPELPPDEKPDGERIQWIPGYWAWDGERKDFLWVSGVFRNAPQGKQFIAGYWTQDGNGWRWVPGYWIDEQRQEVPYVPEPPAPLEMGPQAPAPMEEAVYVPGSWVYRETRYAWRPGYWAAPRPGYVWVAPRYVWTPSGFIYIDGFWDWLPEARGLVFAPVVFTQPVWVGNPRWVYRPSYVVSNHLLFDSCFHHRRSFHFYFGNYYGNTYVGLGYRPWYETHRHDPVFAYHGRHNHRNDPNWFVNVQRTYNDRYAGRAPVPPRTFAQQTTMIRGNGNVVNNTTINNITQVVAPIRNVKQVNNNVKLVKVDNQQLNLEKQRIDRTREISTLRQKNEGAAARATVGGPTTNVRTGSTFKVPALSQNLVLPSTSGLPKTGANTLPKTGTPKTGNPTPGNPNTGTPMVTTPKTPLQPKDPLPKITDTNKSPTVTPKTPMLPKNLEKIPMPTTLPKTQPKTIDLPKTTDPPKKFDLPKLPSNPLPMLEKKTTPLPTPMPKLTPTPMPTPKATPTPKSPPDKDKKKAELPAMNPPVIGSSGGPVFRSGDRPAMSTANFSPPSIRIVSPASDSGSSRTILSSPRILDRPRTEPTVRFTTPSATSTPRRGESPSTPTTRRIESASTIRSGASSTRSTNAGTSTKSTERSSRKNR